MSGPIIQHDYLSLLPKIGDSYKKILSILWVNDTNVFPKPWIDSNYLLSTTQFKNFDRRIRELKSNIGCDIESRNLQGTHQYRLKSPVILQVSSRKNITKTKKASLFRKNKYKCNVCGKRCPSGTLGLQADHKIPLSRGGTNDIKNYQPLCNHCNAIKRTSCTGCMEDCNNCHWAFPERTGRHSMFRMSPKILKPLEKHFGSKHEAEKIVNNILEEYSKFIDKINNPAV